MTNEKKFPRKAVRYMRHMPKNSNYISCKACDGTGWTEQGWTARAQETDPFRGDCPSCNGTGKAS